MADDQRLKVDSLALIIQDSRLTYEIKSNLTKALYNSVNPLLHSI